MDFEPVEFNLIESFSFGNQTLEKLEYVLVKVETKDGTIGLGEAAPYWDPNGETQGSALGALDLLKPEIEGLNVTQINAINTIWEENCRRAFSARAAVDMALYDILGKVYGVPVFK